MTYIDPVVASPNEYKLLLDTERARIVEMRLPPGVSDHEHSHPHEWVYFVRGSKVMIHVGDEVAELDVPDGHAMHHEPWTHRVENVGDRELVAITFELKP
jgi:hypothetical protein